MSRPTQENTWSQVHRVSAEIYSGVVTAASEIDSDFRRAAIGKDLGHFTLKAEKGVKESISIFPITALPLDHLDDNHPLRQHQTYMSQLPKRQFAPHLDEYRQMPEVMAMRYLDLETLETLNTLEAGVNSGTPMGLAKAAVLLDHLQNAVTEKDITVYKEGRLNVGGIRAELTFGHVRDLDLNGLEPLDFLRGYVKTRTDAMMLARERDDADYAFEDDAFKRAHRRAQGIRQDMKQVYRARRWTIQPHVVQESDIPPARLQLLKGYGDPRAHGQV